MALYDNSYSLTEPIEIIRHQPIWAEMFQEEKSRLNTSLAGMTYDIEHIGSTAVVGLAAKPVIDIMLGTPYFDGGDEFDDRLASIGYCNSVLSQFPPPLARFMIRRADSENRSHHLHLVNTRSEFWRTRLMLRDFLRANHVVSDVYAELKKLAAEKYRRDRTGYNAFKEPFIRACIAAAHQQ